MPCEHYKKVPDIKNVGEKLGAKDTAAPFGPQKQ